MFDIISVLGFIIALGSVAYASWAMKMVDEKTDEFFKLHIIGIKSSLSDLSGEVKTLTGQLTTLQKNIQDIQGKQSDYNTVLADIRVELSKQQTDLDKLRSSIQQKPQKLGR